MYMFKIHFKHQISFFFKFIMKLNLSYLIRKTKLTSESINIKIV